MAHMLEDTRLGVVVVIMTAAQGLLELIPDGIGKLASLFGLLLTLLLIGAQIRKIKRDRLAQQKMELEIRALQDQLTPPSGEETHSENNLP
jgi:hypothetical protein